MRTEAGGVFKAANGKYAVIFVSYKGVPGNEYVCSEVESAPVFATEDEAYAGQNRALDMLEETGQFPNMCEAF